VLHPAKASVGRAVVEAKRELARLARPAGEFDASRYFRGTPRLVFYNVGTARVRAFAKTIYRAHRESWSIIDALAFADALIASPVLEVKALGVEVVAGYRRSFTPPLLSRWKRWLADNLSDNWATTDTICGFLIGPLVLAFPAHASTVAAWSRHPNMWVRRASAVGLITAVRRGSALDLAYRVAKRLHSDREDLIQKAVGWLLREAGKADPDRLERYLRANVRLIPRTTFRYAIERFDDRKRRRLVALR
jgi:3-methyladenine DNA glycosylase AlkD